MRPAAYASGPGCRGFDSRRNGPHRLAKEYSALHNQRQGVFCTAISAPNSGKPTRNVRVQSLNLLARTFPLPLRRVPQRCGGPVCRIAIRCRRSVGYRHRRGVLSETPGDNRERRGSSAPAYQDGENRCSAQSGRRTACVSDSCSLATVVALTAIATDPADARGRRKRHPCARAGLQPALCGDRGRRQFRAACCTPPTPTRCAIRPRSPRS